MKKIVTFDYVISVLNVGYAVSYYLDYRKQNRPLPQFFSGQKVINVFTLSMMEVVC